MSRDVYIWSENIYINGIKCTVINYQTPPTMGFSGIQLSYDLNEGETVYPVWNSSDQNTTGTISWDISSAIFNWDSSGIAISNASNVIQDMTTNIVLAENVSKSIYSTGSVRRLANFSNTSFKITNILSLSDNSINTINLNRVSDRGPISTGTIVREITITQKLDEKNTTSTTDKFKINIALPQWDTNYPIDTYSFNYTIVKNNIDICNNSYLLTDENKWLDDLSIANYIIRWSAINNYNNNLHIKEETIRILDDQPPIIIQQTENISIQQSENIDNSYNIISEQTGNGKYYIVKIKNNNIYTTLITAFFVLGNSYRI